MSETSIKEIIIPREYHGKRIDVVLASLLPEYSRAQLTQWLKAGFITLSHRVPKPKEKVNGEEVILFQTHQIQSSVIQDIAQEMPLAIVYEDADMLLINKPAGLIVHPGAGNPSHTLVNGLLHYDERLQALPRAGIIHRLDKDTTGLLIVAKSLAAYTQLIRQMQAREIQRHYLALVHGRILSSGIIETSYGRNPHQRLKMAVTPNGKHALTEYTPRTKYRHFTAMDVKLGTGRTHQIRVHMAYIHHPVVGDPLYGSARFPAGISAALRLALQSFQRQALHAARLSLLHPLSGDPLTFEVPPPDDFIDLLHCLDREEE